MSANREKSKIPFIERKKQYGTSCSTGITSSANFFHLPVETLAPVWGKFVFAAHFFGKYKIECVQGGG